MRAIVYVSNTGFTERYAKMLSKKTGYPVYNFKKAKSMLAKQDEVIFFSWVCSNKIRNVKKAIKKWRVISVCAVGMNSKSIEVSNRLIYSNDLNNIKLFYLQGGFNYSLLKGKYKLMMGFALKMLKSQLLKKQQKTPEDLVMLDMITNGKDCVSEENLSEVTNWYEKDAL